MSSCMMSYIILMIMILISVAFFTLLERKILSHIQTRKGPNKVGLLGMLQPFTDAIKLSSKEMIIPNKSNFMMYYLIPSFALFLILMLWMLTPFLTGMFNFNLGILFFMSITSLSVYTIMISGWSSNSNYSILGSLRSIAQTISYEISLSFILISILLTNETFNMMNLYKHQNILWSIWMMSPLMMMLLVTIMAETNRTPFDLAEGESELVSGFNVEYSSGGFTLIFLAEYTSIIFMSMLMILMFLGSNMFNTHFYMKLIMISLFFIWIRGTLPRYRYDKLMLLCWHIFLPTSLSLLTFYFIMIMYMYT